MKKIRPIIVALAQIILQGSCSTELHDASWQTRPVVADGNPSEWSLPLRFSDATSGLQYNVTNDSANLYICVRATEQPAQMKIISSGMDISIDPDGKKKQVVVIHFPLPGLHNKQSADEMPMGDGQGRKRERMDLAKQYKLQEPQIMLSGFQSAYNGTFKTKDAIVKAALDWDDKNNMTCEMVVPLKSFMVKNAKKKKGVPELNMKINVNAMASLEGPPHGRGMQMGNSGGGQEQPGGMGGGRGGGMGGGGRGGHGGGGHGGGFGGGQPRSAAERSRAYASLHEATNIKFKLKLSGL